MQDLQEVYGCEVLPSSMLEICRRPGGTEGGAALIGALCPVLLRSEEKPVVTRFGLFSPCIAVLFRSFVFWTTLSTWPLQRLDCLCELNWELHACACD